MIDLSVFNVGNLTASIAAGLLAGSYLAVFHPPALDGKPFRRALLSGWYFAFLGSILYAARVAFAIARDVLEADFVTDLPRVTAGWALWLLFAGFVAIGAYLGDRWRTYRLRRRLRAEEQR